MGCGDRSDGVSTFTHHDSGQADRVVIQMLHEDDFLDVLFDNQGAGGIGNEGHL